MQRQNDISAARDHCVSSQVVGSSRVRLGWGETLIPGAASVPHPTPVFTTPQSKIENAASVNTDCISLEEMPVATLQSQDLKAMNYICSQLSKFFQLWQHPSKYGFQLYWR
jgi:hypothetical protein